MKIEKSILKYLTSELRNGQELVSNFPNFFCNLSYIAAHL